MNIPVIRILGGARVQAQRNLQQEPCTITGLSRLTGMAEADLVVLWWDPGIANLPGERESFGDALSADLRREAQECVRDSCAKYRNDFLAKLKKAAAQENLSAEEKARRLGEYTATLTLARPIVLTGLKAPATLLERIFAEFMGNVWAAVRHGGMAFVVIPPNPKTAAAVSLTDAIQRPGLVNPVTPRADAAASIADAIQRFELLLPAKPEAATVISPAEIIEKFRSLIPATPNVATNFMITDVIPQLGLEWDTVPQPVMVPANIPGATEPVRIMAGRLIDLIDCWPFRVGIRTSGRAPLMEQGEIADAPLGLVRYCPAAMTDRGNARALLMMMGQGALLVMPQPRNLEVLVQSFLASWTAPVIDPGAAKVEPASAESTALSVPPTMVPEKSNAITRPPARPTMALKSFRGMNLDPTSFRWEDVTFVYRLDDDRVVVGVKKAGTTELELGAANSIHELEGMASRKEQGALTQAGKLFQHILNKRLPGFDASGIIKELMIPESSWKQVVLKLNRALWKLFFNAPYTGKAAIAFYPDAKCYKVHFGCHLRINSVTPVLAKRELIICDSESPPAADPETGNLPDELER